MSEGVPSQRFLVRDPQGNVYGPADAAMLREWVQQGRIVPGMAIAPRETREWVEASTHPMLADLLQARLEQIRGQGGSDRKPAAPEVAPTHEVGPVMEPQQVEEAKPTAEAKPADALVKPAEGEWRVVTSEVLGEPAPTASASPAPVETPVAKPAQLPAPTASDLHEEVRLAEEQAGVRRRVVMSPVNPVQQGGGAVSQMPASGPPTLAYGGPAPMNVLAMLSAIFAGVGILPTCLMCIALGCVAIPASNLLELTAVTLGSIALFQIHSNPGKYRGKGLAITGVVVGAVVILAYIIGGLVMMFLFSRAAHP